MLLLSIGGNAFVETEAGPGGMLAVVVLLWAACTVMLIWQVVGLWRSADRHAHQQLSRNKTRFWAVLAQVMAVIGVLNSVSIFVKTGAPQIAELYEVVLEGDPSFSDGEFTLLSGGRELSFRGGIKFGTAAELQQILKTAPDIRILHLTSEGGRILEATKLFRLVGEHGLDTYVSNECASACTLVFAAGKRRWLSDAAKLGFHGAAFPGLTEKELRGANEDWAAQYRQGGIDAGFIDRALAVPSDEVWYPTIDELLGARVVTDIDRGDNFQSSGNEAVPTLAQIERSARGNDRRVDALHELSADLAREIYVKIRQDMIAGTTSNETLGAIDLAIEGTATAYLPLADDNVIAEFAALSADRYSSLLKLSAAACYKYARTGLFSEEAMTEELGAKTSDHYERILRTAKERPAPDPALVEAAFTNTIRGMPEELALIYLDPTRDVQPEEYDAYCRGGIAFFQTMARLPHAQIAAITREMYKGRQR